MRKELSISFRAEADKNILQQTAEAAGRYGFDVISVYDDLGDPSPMAPLMTFAKNSETPRIGPACIAVPKYASVEPIVNDISRLSLASNGRAYLGLTAGAWMEKIGLKSASVQQLREAVEVSRYLLEKRDDGFTGRYYKISSICHAIRTFENSTIPLGQIQFLTRNFQLIILYQLNTMIAIAWYSRISIWIVKLVELE